ncbi:hypothetical protein JCM10212_001809 [Sporobolomyces blumeae]
MRPSLVRSIKPVPLSSIPPHALRLPPKPQPKPDLVNSSPTLDKLVQKLSTGSTASARGEARGADLPEDGRGLGRMRFGTPRNLRIEEYVPKKREFEGVSKKHRDLLRRLRREA